MPKLDNPVSTGFGIGCGFVLLNIFLLVGALVATVGILFFLFVLGSSS